MVKYFSALQAKDLMTIFAAIIAAAMVAIGWWVNKRANKSLEVSKERFKRRAAMFEKLKKVVIPLRNDPAPFQTYPNLGKAMGDARADVQQYGLSDEVELYERLITAVECRDVEQCKIATDALAELIVTRQKEELEYGKVKGGKAKAQGA